MILYDKLISRYIIASKIKKNKGFIESMRKSLEDAGFTKEEVDNSVKYGLKENQSKIFKLKRDLLNINKK